MKNNNKYKIESKLFFDKVSQKSHGNSSKLHTYLIKNSSFKDSEMILDLGCGRGEFLDGVSKITSCYIRGVDISPKMIDICNKRNIPNSSFIVGEAEKIPYKDNSFDKVFCLNSFHHYPNPDTVVEEMLRVLKEDGTIIIGEVYVLPLLREVINLLLPLGHCGDYKMYSKRSLNTIFKEGGLINKSFHIIDPFLFVSIYSKRKNH